MRDPGRTAIFNRGKHLGFLVLLLLIFAAIAAWRIGDTAPVAAQARTKLNPNDGLTYVWIPPGTFQMGCSPDDSECPADENPAHSVTLTRGFWIGQTPVTQGAYKKVIDNNPSHFQGYQLPVDQVSWDDAQAYCKGVEMRLPTEAEWEYAARGGSAAARYASVAQIAWYALNSGNTTHEVGQKQANGYGLYDMLGNLWEWTADWFGPYAAAGAIDPRGPQTGRYRVVRGGSWSTGAFLVRVSARSWDVPEDGYNYVNGFRCAGN